MRKMCYVCLLQPERALGLLGYVDKSGLNGGGSGKGSGSGSASQSPEKEREGAHGNKDGAHEGGGEAWRPRASVVCSRKTS